MAYTDLRFEPEAGGLITGQPARNLTNVLNIGACEDDTPGQNACKVLDNDFFGPSGPPTGTMAATEQGSDTAAVSGDVVVQGTAAATETGSDTFAGTGTASNTRTGTMAATESGSDTAALSGDVIVKGNLAASESGSDTLAATGDVVVKGNLVVSEVGSDTLAANADVFVKGTMGVSESGTDTFAASSDIFVSGALAATEGGEDGFAGSGTVTTVVVSGGGGGTLIRFSSPGSAYINSYKSQIRRARKKVQAAKVNPLLAQEREFQQALNEAYLAIGQLAAILDIKERIRLEKEAEALRKEAYEIELKAIALRQQQDEEEELLAANLW